MTKTKTTLAAVPLTTLVRSFSGPAVTAHTRPVVVAQAILGGRPDMPAADALELAKVFTRLARLELSAGHLLQAFDTDCDAVDWDSLTDAHALAVLAMA